VCTRTEAWSNGPAFVQQPYAPYSVSKCPDMAVWSDQCLIHPWRRSGHGIAATIFSRHGIKLLKMITLDAFKQPPRFPIATITVHTGEATQTLLLRSACQKGCTDIQPHPSSRVQLPVPHYLIQQHDKLPMLTGILEWQSD